MGINPYLIHKYFKNFSGEMGTFEFSPNEITFQILKDFRTWEYVPYEEDGEEERLIIFYRD